MCNKDEVLLVEVGQVAFFVALAHSIALLCEAVLDDGLEPVNGIYCGGDVKPPTFLNLGKCDWYGD